MNVADIYVLLVAATVYVACTAIIAVSSIAFAKALTAAHAARLHASQAAATEQTLDQTERALTGAPSRPNGYRRPTKEELLESVMMQRELAEQDEIGDADSNAGYEDDAGAVGGTGGLYREEAL